MLACYVICKVQTYKKPRKHCDMCVCRMGESKVVFGTCIKEYHTTTTRMVTEKSSKAEHHVLNNTITNDMKLQSHRYLWIEEVS